MIAVLNKKTFYRYRMTFVICDVSLPPTTCFISKSLLIILLANLLEEWKARNNIASSSLQWQLPGSKAGNASSNTVCKIIFPITGFIIGIKYTGINSLLITALFVAINITPPAQGSLELHLADGRRIVFRQPVSVEYLKVLIVWFMLHLSASVTYYFYSQAVDMRKGLDSLSGLVQQHMQLNVLNGGVFILLIKSGTRLNCYSGKVMPARAGTDGVFRFIKSAWKEAPMSGHWLQTAAISVPPNCN